MEEYSRKRKRDNYIYNINIERKRKLDEDINNILNKIQKIEYIDINNKKRIRDISDDEIYNNKKNKTYNCYIHDNLKEVCNM